MAFSDINQDCEMKFTPGVKIDGLVIKKCDLTAMPATDTGGKHYDGALDRPGTDPAEQGFGYKAGANIGWTRVKIRAKSGSIDDDIIGSGRSQGVTNSFTMFIEGVDENNIDNFDEFVGSETVWAVKQKNNLWRIVGSIEDPCYVQSGAKLSTDTEAKDGDVHGLAMTVSVDTNKAARIYKNAVFTYATAA